MNCLTISIATSSINNISFYDENNLRVADSIYFSENSESLTLHTIRQTIDSQILSKNISKINVDYYKFGDYVYLFYYNHTMDYLNKNYPEMLV
jgi:hypothetical protein